MRYGLTLTADTSFVLQCYSDADWASCPDDRKSTGGFCTFLGSNLLSWSSSKQKVVSRSSTESEYRALADGVAELIWLESLLQELRVPLVIPPIINCDNQSTTQLAANPVLHARTKHVEIDYHFVHQRVVSGLLQVQHVTSEDQLADPLTKALSTNRFLDFRSKLTVLHQPVL